MPGAGMNMHENHIHVNTVKLMAGFCLIFFDTYDALKYVLLYLLSRIPNHLFPLMFGMMIPPLT